MRIVGENSIRVLLACSAVLASTALVSCTRTPINKSHYALSDFTIDGFLGLGGQGSGSDGGEEFPGTEGSGSGSGGTSGGDGPISLFYEPFIDAVGTYSVNIVYPDIIGDPINPLVLTSEQPFDQQCVAAQNCPAQVISSPLSNPAFYSYTVDSQMLSQGQNIYFIVATQGTHVQSFLASDLGHITIQETTDPSGGDPTNGNETQGFTISGSSVERAKIRIKIPEGYTAGDVLMVRAHMGIPKNYWLNEIENTTKWLGTKVNGGDYAFQITKVMRGPKISGNQDYSILSLDLRAFLPIPSGKTAGDWWDIKVREGYFGSEITKSSTLTNYVAPDIQNFLTQNPITIISEDYYGNKYEHQLFKASNQKKIITRGIYVKEERDYGVMLTSGTAGNPLPHMMDVAANTTFRVDEKVLLNLQLGNSAPGFGTSNPAAQPAGPIPYKYIRIKHHKDIMMRIRHRRKYENVASCPNSTTPNYKICDLIGEIPQGLHVWEAHEPGDYDLSITWKSSDPVKRTKLESDVRFGSQGFMKRGTNSLGQELWSPWNDQTPFGVYGIALPDLSYLNGSESAAISHFSNYYQTEYNQISNDVLYGGNSSKHFEMAHPNDPRPQYSVAYGGMTSGNYIWPTCRDVARGLFGYSRMMLMEQDLFYKVAQTRQTNINNKLNGDPAWSWDYAAVGGGTLDIANYDFRFPGPDIKSFSCESGDSACFKKRPYGLEYGGVITKNGFDSWIYPDPFKYKEMYDQSYHFEDVLINHDAMAPYTADHAYHGPWDMQHFIRALLPPGCMALATGHYSYRRYLENITAHTTLDHSIYPDNNQDSPLSGTLEAVNSAPGFGANHGREIAWANLTAVFGYSFSTEDYVRDQLKNQFDKEVEVFDKGLMVPLGALLALTNEDKMIDCNGEAGGSYAAFPSNCRTIQTFAEMFGGRERAALYYIVYEGANDPKTTDLLNGIQIYYQNFLGGDLTWNPVSRGYYYNIAAYPKSDALNPWNGALVFNSLPPLPNATNPANDPNWNHSAPMGGNLFNINNPSTYGYMIFDFYTPAGSAKFFGTSWRSEEDWNVPGLLGIAAEFVPDSGLRQKLQCRLQQLYGGFNNMVNNLENMNTGDPGYNFGQNLEALTHLQKMQSQGVTNFCN